MKTNKLFVLAVLLLGVSMHTSCSTEEQVMKENANSFKFAKSTEMLNFENQLKVWFNSKNESDLSKRTVVASETEKIAKELMVSLGKDEIGFSKKQDQSTDEYIRVVMREYSKALTELYNQQNQK